MHEAARKIQAAGIARAAVLLDCESSAVSIEGSRFGSRVSNRNFGWDDLVAGTVLEASGSGPPGQPTYPHGCHVCEIEIDPATGAVEIVAYTAVDDFGICLDREAVTGQVLGGIAQGIGQALFEDIRLELDSGQLQVGSLMDYGVPRALGMPPVALTLVESHPCRTNALGVKGCGQAGAIAALGAVLGAVNDALTRVDARRVDAPATPPRIWESLVDRPVARDHQVRA